ncbi:unnamed protein product [Timema podura]|uniref:Uncharacterized protein n=1 Tax=Timema podura TaxID=61482 RepID=A0ABN7P866_TIMPD|nr:unnamed protein product [Timema podura]
MIEDYVIWTATCRGDVEEKGSSPLSWGRTYSWRVLPHPKTPPPPVDAPLNSIPSEVGEMTARLYLDIYLSCQ